MDDPRVRHARFNAESFEQWDGFSEHRRRVSGLLAVGSGRLCVLGVGNANDLDLIALLEAYREVHLVDLDAGALGRGVARQGLADHPRLIRHGNLDVTGMLDAMAVWSPSGEISGVEIEALVDWPASRVGLALPGPFEVVASTCLLSQLVGNAHHALGRAHPRFLAAVRAIRLGHLRLMASLARPGGRVVLITDIASSDWVRGLGAIPESDLPRLIPTLAAEHGVIHGTNPAELLALFRRDPVLAARLVRVQAVHPWPWRLHRRTYLVCGFTATADPVLR